MDHMEEGEKLITEWFGGKKVDYCYNPTAMASVDDTLGYLGDLTQAGTQKLGRVTQEVDSLVKHFRQALADVGKRGMVVHIAHSQGALITSLAAKKLSLKEMRQIEVLAFGGAAALRRTARTPFRRCINYYSVNDPILFLVPPAEKALRSGFAGDEEFCFLVPRVGDPITDHNILAPTYAQALQWEGTRFQRQYQSSLSRTVRISSLLCASILQEIHRKLLAAIKSTLRLALWIVTCPPLARMLWLLIRTILKPILLTLALLWEVSVDLYRSITGDKKYVPATVILEEEAV